MSFRDGQERNCKGSVHFKENFPDCIKHCINLDMVGRGVTDSIACICSKTDEQQYLGWINEAADRWNLHLDITTESEYDILGSSDQRLLPRPESLVFGSSAEIAQTLILRTTSLKN